MARITIFIRTRKTEGNIKLRFRLQDSRKFLDLYYRSEIVCDLNEISCFEVDGSVKKGKSTLFNSQLKKNIHKTMEAMSEAYEKYLEQSAKGGGFPLLSSEDFTRMVEEILYPERYDSYDTILSYFDRFIKEKVNDEISPISESSHLHYRQVRKEFEYFLASRKLETIKPQELTKEMVEDFASFLTISHSGKSRCKNSVAMYMILFKCFITDLEESDVISKSPFRSIKKAKRQSMCHQAYIAPIFLTEAEFEKVLTSEVPKRLKDTRDTFLINSALGCRQYDLYRLTRENIHVTEEGIPYVHYIPSKTEKYDVEMETPIVRYAFDLLRARDYRFAARVVFKSYNLNLKKLFKYLGLAREVKNKEGNEIVFRELWEVASSKLARKTYVNLTAKVNINPYAGGLHSDKSNAVKNYFNMSIQDRFSLLNIAFNQSPYRVNKDLELLE